MEDIRQRLLSDGVTLISWLSVSGGFVAAVMGPLGMAEAKTDDRSRAERRALNAYIRLTRRSADHAHAWQDRRAQLFDLIFRKGHSLASVARHLGYSAERIRQVVHELDLPYSGQSATVLWCPWQAAVHPCLGGCGRQVKGAGRCGHGLCLACYGKWRYAQPAYKAAHKVWSNRGRQQRLAQGRCANCSQPAAPGHRCCEYHLAYFREWSRKHRRLRQ